MNTKADKYKIVFLALVHEAIDCVEDMIQNIHALCPNSALLFHVNANCDDEYWEQAKKLEEYYDFAYLLPTRLPSDWDSGLQLEVYFDMFDYVIEKLDFEYVYLTASNSLIINPNLESIVDQADVFYYQPGEWREGWAKDGLEKDISFKNYISKYDNKVYVGCCEGMCMNLDVIQLLQKELKPVLDYKHADYIKVEYILPTAFVHIPKNFRHIEQNLEKWTWVPDGNIHHYGFEVECVREYVFDFILNNNFEALNKMWVYSLKRLDRVYTDYYRSLIREHFGYTNNLY